MKKRYIITIATIAIILVVIYLVYKTEIDRMAKKNILNKNTDIPDIEPLVFNEKVKVNHDQFIQDVRNIGIDLDIHPDSLMYWIDFESAGTFSPSIVNKSSGATGLIQFMPTTAKELGTTTADLAKMTNLEQLKFVKTYFKLWIKRLGKLNNWLDPYLIIFYPAAKGKPDEYSLPKYVTPQNPAFDYTIKDGVITVGEIRKFFQDRIKTKVPTMYLKYFGL